jgi:hypothetical protein
MCGAIVCKQIHIQKLLVHLLQAISPTNQNFKAQIGVSFTN